MKTNFHSHCRHASTRTDVLIVVATLVLLASIFWPTITRSRLSRQNQCLSNLKQIGLAFRLWNQGDRFSWFVTTNEGGTFEFVESTNVFLHFRAISNELGSSKILVCPRDSGKTPAKDFNKFDNRNLSYVLGLEAHDGIPQRILSGDRNLTTNGVALGSGISTLGSTNGLGWAATIHNKTGNIGLSDGSVQQLSPATLQKQWEAAKDSGAIGRVAIP